jgi:hypothetical protein
MLTSEIIKAAKRHKGSFYVEVIVRSDIHHFRVTKAEMLFRLSNVLDGEAGFRLVGADGFIFGREW